MDIWMWLRVAGVFVIPFVALWILDQWLDEWNRVKTPHLIFLLVTAFLWLWLVASVIEP